MKSELSEREIRRLLTLVRSRRARIVVDRILKHGSITTEQLQKLGYEHPPRAARDVREAGIPLETFRVKSKQGRSIAAYKLGDITEIREDRFRGRRGFPKRLKEDLYRIGNGKRAICLGEFDSRYLQIDHRVPYEVAGDIEESEWNIPDYMLLCGSCNRAKSWSCEHCANWLNDKLPRVCLRCYWTSPENYAHIALREVRRLDILWDRDEIQAYERLKLLAQRKRFPMPEHVKKIISKHLSDL